MATPVNSQKEMRTLLRGSLTDRILLLGTLAATISAWFIIQSALTSGPAVAEIYYGKTMLATYPLPKHGEKPIQLQVEGRLGASEVVLDDQGVRIAASPCDTKRCVYSGAHRHAGGVIACIPNRILITIRGDSDRRFDAIVE